MCCLIDFYFRKEHCNATSNEAVAEIGKTAKLEACSLPSQAELYHKHVNNHKDQWEQIFFKLKESKSYRQTIGSISSSCLTAATPLLSSMKQTACLVTLGIIQDGLEALARVEESYRHERKTRQILAQALLSNSLNEQEDLRKKRR